MADSKRKRVFDFIAGHKPDENGFVRLTPSQVAEQMKVSNFEAQQVIGSLKHTGNIETDVDNNRVVGIKIVKAPGKWRRIGGTAAKAMRRKAAVKSDGAAVATMVPTPNIDRYVRARESFDKITQDESMQAYVEAQWKDNPLAEEGATLKNTLQATQANYRELQERFNGEHRELEYLRKTQNKELRKGLQAAGVVHAGD